MIGMVMEVTGVVVTGAEVTGAESTGAEVTGVGVTTGEIDVGDVTAPGVGLSNEGGVVVTLAAVEFGNWSNWAAHVFTPVMVNETSVASP